MEEKDVKKKTSEKKVEKTKTLNESIISIRVNLQNSKLKKSGKNKFAGFEYFELSDFLPRVNELMLEENVNDRFYIKDEYAYLELIKGDEKQEYTMPFERFETPVNIKIDPKTKETREVKSMQDIQYLGALNTYYKRYLYLNAFGITDGEVIDSMDNEDIKVVRDDTNYKQLLMDKLKELNMDIAKYAKENKLSAKTTQERAKKLLEDLELGVEDTNASSNNR